MDYDDGRRIALLTIIPIVFVLGYFRGKRKGIEIGKEKGEGMIKMAERMAEQNAKMVDRLNEKVKEINRATLRIQRWEEEHLEDF